MAPPHPVSSVPPGSMQRHSYEPRSPVWKRKVVTEFGATGTLRPSAAMVNVCDRSASGSSAVTCRTGFVAFGLTALRSLTANDPTIPYAFAYCSLPAGSGVAVVVVDYGDVDGRVGRQDDVRGHERRASLLGAAEHVGCVD